MKKWIGIFMMMCFLFLQTPVYTDQRAADAKTPDNSTMTIKPAPAATGSEPAGTLPGNVRQAVSLNPQPEPPIPAKTVTVQPSGQGSTSGTLNNTPGRKTWLDPQPEPPAPQNSKGINNQ